MVLAGAEPWQARGGERGALLVHGLTGSPAEMRPLAEALRERGLSVFVLRLPGHGTTLADLARTTADQWLDAVLDGYHLLRDVCGSVAICGASMGALLALVASTLVDVDKTVAMAAPIYIRKPQRLATLPTREQCAGLFAPKARRRLPDVPERYTIGYDAMPLVSVHELLSLIARAKESLPKLRQPLLVVQGQRDHTVDPESARYVIEHVASADKRLLWLRHSGHRLTLDGEREVLARKLADFILNGRTRTEST